MTDTTGPKISSRAIRIDGCTSAKIVGSWNQPRAYAPVLEPMPAEDEPSHLPAGRSRRSASPSASCDSLIDGPICTPSTPPSPTRSALTRAGELGEELVVHLLVDDDAAGGRASLSGRAEAAPHAAFDRQLQLRIVHDDDDVLAAHLEMHFLESRRGVLVDQPADRRSIR